MAKGKECSWRGHEEGQGRGMEAREDTGKGKEKWKEAGILGTAMEGGGMERGWRHAEGKEGWKEAGRTWGRSREGGDGKRLQGNV